MKSTIKEINAIVERVRSGQPLELPEGKTEVSYYDPILRGLYLRIKKGKASWFVYWKIFRRKHTAAIGNATLFDRRAAVDAARDLLAKVRLDRLDPRAAMQERMQASKVKFKDVAPLFIAACEERLKKNGIRVSTVRSWKRYLGLVERPPVSDAAPKQKYVQYLQSLHNEVLADITTNRIQLVIDDIAIRCGRQVARSCRTVLKQFFKWASERDRYLPASSINPAFKVIQPAKSEQRDRVLTDDEIRLIWKTCEEWEADCLRDQRLRAATGQGLPGAPRAVIRPRAIMLALLTGMRRQEIADLRWTEVDIDGPEKYVHIPKERIKTQHDLCNPLGDWAVELLGQNLPKRNDGFVFPPCTTNGRRINEGSVRRISSTDALLDKRIVKAGRLPPPDWTFHDLRRSFRTRLGMLGVKPDVGEALINHVGHLPKLERNYDVNEYWSEKRIALTKLEDHLRAVLAGTAPKIASPLFGVRSIRR